LKGLSILKDRVLLRGYDLFISPVYEQALLLAEDETVSVAKLADQLLEELINSQSLAAVSSGIYVYCHRKRVSETISKTVKETLVISEEASIVRFLTLAPNVPESRMLSLFQELDVIWNRGKWREQEHVLVLLERLVPRHPLRVKAFINEHTIIEYMATLPPTYAGNRKLLRVLWALASFDPDWVWDSLIALYSGTAAIAVSRDLQANILNCLCENSTVFGANNIASRFEASISMVDLDAIRDIQELSDSYGRLWAIEWDASKTPKYLQGGDAA
jgi:hypothetical protein